MHNLFRLSSLAYASRDSSSKPRMDRELLAAHGRGLIATTGCPSGEVQTRLRLGQYDEALKAGGRVPRHLRRGELLRRAHGPRPGIERRIRDGLLRLAAELDLPLVVDQ